MKHDLNHAREKVRVFLGAVVLLFTFGKAAYGDDPTLPSVPVTANGCPLGYFTVMDDSGEATNCISQNSPNAGGAGGPGGSQGGGGQPVGTNSVTLSEIKIRAPAIKCQIKATGNSDNAEYLAFIIEINGNAQVSGIVSGGDDVKFGAALRELNIDECAVQSFSHNHPWHVYAPDGLSTIAAQQNRSPSYNDWKAYRALQLEQQTYCPGVILQGQFIIGPDGSNRYFSGANQNYPNEPNQPMLPPGVPDNGSGVS